MRPLIADRSLAGLRGLMDRIRDRTGESVSLFVRSGTHQVTMEMSASHQPIRYELAIGTTFPVQMGAAGRAALMPLDEAELGAILGDPSLSLGAAEVAAVRREVALSVERGDAVSSGERVEGAGAIACPVLEVKGAPFAMPNIMYPAFRLIPDQVKGFGEYLRRETRSRH